MKKILKIFIILILIPSCQSAKDAFTLQKKNTTDEFLVEKKEPLVMPPDYNKIPEPDSLKKSQVDEKDKIRKILKKDKLKAETKQNNSSNKIEQSIIDKIR